MPSKISNGVEVLLTSEEEKELELEQIQVNKEKEEYEKVAYKDKRKFAYPKIGDQLDDLFKKGAFSDEMSGILNKVKNDFPKPK